MGMPSLPPLPALPAALPGTSPGALATGAPGELAQDASGTPVDFAALLSRLGQGSSPGQPLDLAAQETAPAGLPLTTETLPTTPHATLTALEAALSASSAVSVGIRPADDGTASADAERLQRDATDPLLDAQAQPAAAEILALITPPVTPPPFAQASLQRAQPALNADPNAKGQSADLSLLQQLTSADGQPAETAKIAAEPMSAENGTASFSQMLHTASTSQPTKSTPHSTHIPTPVHDHAWAQGFGERITWLAKQDIQAAQITLNPPQLGPIQIALNLNGDQASASFGVANADVRQAIENALPQLREMFASAGIQLGDANVGAQLPQQARDQAAQMAGSRRGTDENAILPAQDNLETGVITRATRQGSGLVDLFA